MEPSQIVELASELNKLMYKRQSTKGKSAIMLPISTLVVVVFFCIYAAKKLYDIELGVRGAWTAKEMSEYAWQAEKKNAAINWESPDVLAIQNKLRNKEE